MMLKLKIKEPAPYFSYQDEKHFFEWLESIDAINNIIRVGAELELSIIIPIDDDSLFDLIAVLRRYNLEMKCLQKLCHQSNINWFKNEKASWFKLVFN